MLAVTVLVSAIAVAPAVRPRDCTTCGVYAGPNLSRVLDPYLRKVNIWPEFSYATCTFEVARGAYVKLDRPSCASEAAYRATRGVS